MKADAEEPAKLAEASHDAHPFGRMPEQGEAALAAHWIGCRSAPLVTGRTFSVHGGRPIEFNRFADIARMEATVG